MESLIAALQSSSEYTRSSAATSLGELGAICAIQALTVASNDTSERVRKNVGEALVKLRSRETSRPSDGGVLDDDSGMTLDQALKVIRTAPAGAPIVDTTCQLLVLQVMCGKIDREEAERVIRDIMGERDPGQNALSNAARAIGALSAVRK